MPTKSITRSRSTAIDSEAVRGGGANLLLGPSLALACELLIQSAAPPDCTGGWLLDQLESIAMAPRIAHLWSLVLLCAVYIGSVVGVVFLLARRVWLPLLLLIVGYFITVSAGGEAYSRMRIPLFPYLSILFGVGAFVSLSLFTNKRSATAGQRLERVTLPAQHNQGMNRRI